jgi:endonuclease/exonuclease/phosphatase family metal-dependent hydrolase
LLLRSALLREDDVLDQSTHGLSSSAQPGPELKVMTLNLRYASTAPPHAWPRRRPAMRALLDKEAPDVLGTQEGLYGQLQELAGDLPAYGWIGQGREGGVRGEFTAVFYRKERLEPLESGHFWLSRTPEVAGSRSWWCYLPRMVTWVRFRDLRDGRQFYFVNTHLDHLSGWARLRGVELIRRRVLEFRPGVPVLLVGDFNAPAGRSRVYDLLVNPDAFRDTWEASGRRGQAIGTFHGFRGKAPGGRRIDWILVRGPVTTDSAEVVTFAQDGQYPSDHFPVVARLRLCSPSPAG